MRRRPLDELRGEHATPRHLVAICDGVPTAVAAPSEVGSVERATRAFVDRFDVRDGSLASCAMLELSSRTATAPNAEPMVSLEAIALQLGAIAQLLELTEVPRWRMGRSSTSQPEAATAARSCA